MGLPDGPNMTPAQLAIRWMAAPLALLTECRARFGDAFTLDFGPDGRWVVLSDPRAVQEVLTGSPECFFAGRPNAILRPLLGEHSLFFLEGARHLAHRRLLKHPFEGARKRQRGQTIQALTRAHTAAWGEGDVVDPRETLRDISLAVIMRTVFGVLDERARGALSDALLATLEGGFVELAVLRRRSSDGPSPSGLAAFDARRDALRALLDAEIAARAVSPRARDNSVLADLLAHRAEVEPPLTDADVRDQLLTLLVAGHETTATALAWALHWLHQDRAIEAWLRAALAELGPECGPEALAALPELDATCRETLRIVPVIPVIGRELQSPCVVAGHELEAGVTVAPCVYLIHRRADLFAEPERFRPQRFLERQYSPYEYLPFGGGVRRCLGMSFALHQMKLVLATLLQRFRFEPASDAPVRPVRRSVTLSPAGGTQLRVLERRDAPRLKASSHAR